jgi:plasmid maintenance system antidote protein VapI
MRVGRIGKNPTADDTFLERICIALDMPPRMLAHAIGVEYAELEPLLDARHKLVEIDRDEVWWKLAEYVNVRLGTLMAIRHELDKALQRDRASRAVRIARQRQRVKKPSPRS